MDFVHTKVYVGYVYMNFGDARPKSFKEKCHSFCGIGALVHLVKGNMYYIGFPPTGDSVLYLLGHTVLQC